MRHTHHRLLALGLGHSGVTLVLIAFNVLAVGVALCTGAWPIWLGILTVFLAAVLFELVLFWLYTKKNGKAL